MPFLIAIIVIACFILIWMLRAHSTIRAVRELNQDTRGLRRRASSGIRRFIGSPHTRIRDPRLAAVVLMIQLVRTGTPMTTDEKVKIIELMSDPLQVDDPDAM